MAKTELPLAAAAGVAVPGAIAERAPRAPIDWRQLSHELRTPLNAILGHAELLLDGSCGPLSAQARASLGEVQIAGRDLLRQVILLLAWSELNVGGSQQAKRRVDLIALVREAWSRPDAIRIEPHDARLAVRGERSRLQMLVGEIMALESARGAAPRLSVGTRAGHSTLCFAWSGFCVARIGALRIAVIEALARSQGAELALHADGVWLLWPRRQLDAPETTGSTGHPR